MLEHTRLPLAVIEYRLAPIDPHPAQITDVLSAFNLLSDPKLLSCEEEEAPRWNRERLILTGHSAGAFMCLQILLQPPTGSTSPHDVPTLLRNKIDQVFLVDGIYDLPSLLDEYPSYSSFVSEAFGGPSAANYELESPARWSVPSSVLERRTRFHILHSKLDDLLSLRQPDFLHERLEAAFANAGPRSASPTTIQVDYDTLQGAHYDVVHSKVEHLGRYVARAVLPGDSSTTP